LNAGSLLTLLLCQVFQSHALLRKTLTFQIALPLSSHCFSLPTDIVQEASLLFIGLLLLGHFLVERGRECLEDAGEADAR